jgi:predicted O-linked N-acetylglucosamine transferase (SPINDLY family)
MCLLRAVPGSVLWLLGDNDAATCNLRAEAAARGVESTRLIFAQRTDPAAHLARHRLADLFLDTLPYNAHTTASDALWAGLPVLTCRGNAFAGRVAASLLHAVGLPQLVTTSLEEYQARALELVRDPPQLAGLRARLASNRMTQPLFDTQRFCRHLEKAYSAMWQRYGNGLPPESFEVPAL